MPLFTAQHECYMLPSGFWVLGEVARGEVISATPGSQPMFSDQDIISLCEAMSAETTMPISTALQNGRFLLLSTLESDTDPAMLSAFQQCADDVSIPGNFVGATWPAGGTPYTVTAAGVLTFTETDRENFEVAIGKAIQQSGMYYDVDTVTRYANTLTVTLDESQKPYDAGWDSVLALVADWFGGELP